MVRRVVEEDVTTPDATVIHDDSSWVGRTIVTLVILALLVIGAVWLVRALSDNNGNTTINPNPNVTQNQQPNDQNSPAPQPSNVLPS